MIQLKCIVLLTFSTFWISSSNAELLQNTNNSKRVLEVNFKSLEDKSASALVVWSLEDKPNVQSSKLKATVLRTFADFSWVEIPTDAKGFLISSDVNKKEFEVDDFISLESSVRSYRVDLGYKDGLNEILDFTKSYALGNKIANTPKFFDVDSNRTDLHQVGWVYLGSWNPVKELWNHVYWQIPSNEYHLHPTKFLSDQEVVLNVPLPLRSCPKLDCTDLFDGKRKLRPGLKTKILRVSVLPYLDILHEVWIKVGPSK